jgi:hypothetical protein
MPRHHYTSSGPVEITVDTTTDTVTSVRFGILKLPFRVYADNTPQQCAVANPVENIAIEEITYVDLEEERSQ